MNDRLLEIQDTTRFVGRFYSPAFPEYGDPHSSSDGVYTEGLAYALELASACGDKRRAVSSFIAIEDAVANLISLQLTAKDAGSLQSPEAALGAFRVRAGSEFIRIDCIGHIMDAYRRILQVLSPTTF
jgi:hypothetical protein